MTKVCTKCKQEKAISEFGRDKQKRDGLRSACKDCNREVAKAWEANNYGIRAERSRVWKRNNRTHVNETNHRWRKSDVGSISELLGQAKKRAKQAGLPFALTAADVQVPELCPVFNRPLVRKTGKGPSPWSPSLDKIIPSKGYVPGNVMILSHKANVMKNDATPEELRLFADWIYQNLTGDIA